MKDKYYIFEDEEVGLFAVAANYEEDDEQLSFDDFDEGVEDFDGHEDDV